MPLVNVRERLGRPTAITALDGEDAVYVVGGAVRDVLLGRAPHELDFVVEGDAVAVARRAADRLGGRVTVHERFGTATVEASDVSFDLAGAQMAAGNRDASADALLEIVKRDRDWNDGAARKRFLQLLEAQGLEDPWSGAQRRRLSALLFT